MFESPLLSEADAMKILGCSSPKDLQKHIRQGRLKWYGQTRTFARKQVEALAIEIEKEILGDDGAAVERKAEEVDSLDGFRLEPSLG